MSRRVAGGVAAGELREQFSFWADGPETQGPLGNKRGAPAKQFTVRGNLSPLTGGETVMAARLTSRQPYILTVRQSNLTRQITTDWYVTKGDANATPSTEVRFNIRTVTDPDQKRAWLDLLVESGVAI